MEILKWEISPRKNKKYMVTLSDGSKVHFGDKRYDQYRDTTPLGAYSHKDHNNFVRRELYRERHRNIMNKKHNKPAYKVKFSPAWFSYNYLWHSDDT